MTQQIFNIGNFTGPMLLAAMATLTGGWNATCWLTTFFALLGAALTLVLSRKNSPFSKAQ